MKAPLRVLIVEDSENDVERVIRQLKKAKYSVQHERVETAKDMKSALEKQTWDIVISDYKLPRFNAPAALAILQKANLHIPFIVVSHSIGEETAVELMKAGAHDYLLKSKLARLAPVIQRELTEAQLRRERKQSEEALRDREAQLSLIYNNVNDIIFILAVESNDRFRFTSVNCRFLEVTGLSEDQVIGKLIQDVMPKSVHALVLGKYREAIQTRQPVHWEEVTQYPTGRKVGEVTAVPVFEANGNCAQLIGTVHDITKRKQVEEENKLLAQAVKSTKDCISITDLENNILFVNNAFLSTYGYSEDELLGKNISIIRSSRVSSEQSNSIQSGTLREGWHGEILNRRKDGTEFAIEIWTSVVRDNAGNPIAMVGVARDITERKRAEMALRESMEKFRMVFDNAHDGISIFEENPDPFKRRIIDCNNRYAEMAGRSREELLLLGTIHTLMKNLSHEYEHKDIQSIGFGVPFYGSSSWIRPDGKYNIIEYTGVQIEMQGKVCTIGIDRDVTERKRSEEALRKSEETLLRITNSIEDVLYSVDSQTQEFTYLSPAFERLLGYTMDDVLQMGGRRAFLSKVIEGGQFKQQDDGFEKLRSSVKSEAPIWEAWWRCKDGSLVCLEDRSTPIYDGDRLLSTNGDLRNITNYKLAEKVLQESEERYRRLVEFSPDAIAVHSEGKIVYVNPATIMLLGANNATDLIGKPFLDIIHPDYRDSVHQQIIAVLKEDYALPLTEEKFIRLDGSIVEVEVAALPIIYKEKSAMQIVVRDISEQKKLQNQLIQTQKIQSIGTLAGGIAHDFNNILGIILAYSSLLEKNKLAPDKFAVSVTAINQAVQRGAALVRQILTFARKTDIVFEPMDISELIDELLSMLEQTFPKTITFSKNIANSLPLIFADRTQAHQAILNLCINARDAMPHGGSISISAEKQTKEQMHQQFPTAHEETYVCLTVTDSGKGMDKATCLRVFDPFFTTKEKGKGTGLGLSVVYGVVQAHHGFIDLKSELGCGTTFRLFFPVPTIDEKAINTQPSIESIEVGGTETILFVEDEELLIQMVSFLLESKGYNVLCARDGLEAVNVYQSNKQKIALVITDMGLPVMTGTDEFKKLKEIHPSVKVLFASGYFEPDVKSELLKDGAHGFIQKPYEPGEILRIIRQVLDKQE